MITTARIRILPTLEQTVIFWKSAGTARWAYNHMLAENERQYEAFKMGLTNVKSIHEAEVRKTINNVLKKTTHQWLGEVSAEVMKQGVKDANQARIRWFKGISDKPRFKSKHKAKPSFYVRYDKVKRTQNGFKGERLGSVRTTQPLPKLKKGQHYSNPRISFDGFYWYLTIGYKITQKSPTLTGESLGIDVGIKALAVCSNGTVFRGVNKTKRVKQIEKKLRREQRCLSRKFEMQKKSGRKRDASKNLAKQILVVKKQYQILTNIRNNYIHQATAAIVKTKPSQIVMETLNISGMMKNKHLAKAIQNQKLHEFKRQIMYKCERNGIKFVAANMWFPSSKRCSHCGKVKTVLKLSERTYSCDCGFSTDRDLNAAINLANYIQFE